jgi:hypothetical protein
MKEFISIAFNFAESKRQVEEFRNLLESKPDLKERDDILPFFKARPELSALCGLYGASLRRCDLVAWEHGLFGDFACDLVVGDSARHAFAFIEFEDALPQSLFRKVGKKATTEWSDRFEHGFSQIIDWFYKLADRRNSDDCEVRFGKRAIDYVGILVVGRDDHLQPGEKLRFEWRRQHVIVDSRKVLCLTFDELCADLLERLESIALTRAPRRP